MESPMDGVDEVPVALDRTDIDAALAPRYDYRALMVDQRLQDMARRFICGEDVTAIARSYGLGEQAIRRWMADPRFIAIYEEAKARILGDIDKVLREENVELYLRKMALAKRGVTALARGIEVAKAHVDEYGTAAKPSIVKALMDGAIAAIDRDPAMEHRKRGDGKEAPQVAVNVMLTPEKASLIRTSITESGIDISDVLDGWDPVVNVPALPEPPVVDEASETPSE